MWSVSVLQLSLLFTLTLLLNGLSLSLSLTTLNTWCATTHRPFRYFYSPTTHSPTALLTTPIFHMGHSHAHHHNHKKDSNDNTKLLTQAQKTQKRLRRVALWIFCAMAIVGPKRLAHPFSLPTSIPRSDWMTLIISIVALSSADTLRRNFMQYWHKLQGLWNAIAKHSSSPPESSSSKRLSKTIAKSNVMYALSQQQPSGNVVTRDTSDADRVTWIGVVINVVLSIGKLMIGVQQHSSYVRC
jgi:cation transport ATPase